MSQILFIDDNLELSEKLSNFLKSEGIKVSSMAQADHFNQPNVLTIGDVEMDFSAREVTVAGYKVELTSTEFNILNVLMSEAGKVITKADLSETVLGRKLMRYDRSIDMHISNLRHKLTQYGKDSNLIKTVRGIGYQYTAIFTKN